MGHMILGPDSEWMMLNIFGVILGIPAGIGQIFGEQMNDEKGNLIIEGKINGVSSTKMEIIIHEIKFILVLIFIIFLIRCLYYK